MQRFHWEGQSYNQTTFKWISSQANAEGHRLQAIDINISANWLLPETDDEEIREANSDLNDLNSNDTNG